MPALKFSKCLIIEEHPDPNFGSVLWGSEDLEAGGRVTSLGVRGNEAIQQFSIIAILAGPT